MNEREPSPRYRVVFRWYAGDARRHAYLAEDLAGSDYQQVHPVCHPSLGYHLAHPTDMISPATFREPGGTFDACGSCALWLRRNLYETFFDNEIVQQRGVLEIPKDIRRREQVDAAALVPTARHCDAVRIADPTGRIRCASRLPMQLDGHGLHGIQLSWTPASRHLALTMPRVGTLPEHHNGLPRTELSRSDDDPVTELLL